MVPEETLQQVTDSLPKSQSKSDITQQDSPVMICDSPMMPPSPDEDVVSSRIPEIPQPCVTTLEEAASIELPLNVEEYEYNRTSHDASSSHQNDAQGPSSSFLSQVITAASESGPQVDHWASRTASLGGGVQPPNISYGSADTSLANNPMEQNNQMRMPSFFEIYDYQLELLNREQVSLQKNYEETVSELKGELDNKMAEIQRDYDRKSQEVDSEYISQAMKEEVFRSSIVMSSLLSNGFLSKCTDRSVATGIASVRARSSQPSTQTVQRNTPCQSSVTSETPVPTTQPMPIPQEATVQSNTSVNSTVLPQPSVTSVEEPRPLLSPRSITSQQSPNPQLATVQSNSTVLPQPSVTSVKPRPLHSPRSITPQPRPNPQQATVQSNSPMNSTVLPQPSVASVEESRPLLSPRTITPQPRPISQQAMVRSNRHASSAALSLPSVTSEAVPLQSPLNNNTPQPRAPPLIPNHTPSSSYSAAFTPPVQGGVRTMPPHLRSSRASSFASPAAAAASTTNQDPTSASTAASTTNPTSLVQEQQQQQEKSDTGLVYLSDDEE